MHALKFGIQSNPWNWYSCIGRPTGRGQGITLGWQNFFTVSPINLRRASPVSPLSEIWGRVPRQLNSAGACAYLLIWVVGASAQVHFSCRRHRRSRRYNSTTQRLFLHCFLHRVYGKLYKLCIEHCPAFSCPVISCLAFSCVVMCCNLVRQFRILHFYPLGFWWSVIFRSCIFSRPNSRTDARSRYRWRFGSCWSREGGTQGGKTKTVDQTVGNERAAGTSSCSGT